MAVQEFINLPVGRGEGKDAGSLRVVNTSFSFNRNKDLIESQCKLLASD